MNAGSFLNPLGTIHRAIGVGMAAVILGLTAWALRLDHLRADHLTALTQITTVLERALGQKQGSIKVPDTFKAVVRLELNRDHWKSEASVYQRERDNARAVVKAQSDSIRRYEAETNRLRSISEERAKLAASLIKDRDHWIAEARKAASRSQKQACEAELAEVEEVLDALYNADF